MSYFLYPEQESHLNITVETLADNGIKFRIKREYSSIFAPFSIMFSGAKQNYQVEIFCDYDKFTFIKYLIEKKLTKLEYLDKCLKLKTEKEKKVSCPHIDISTSFKPTVRFFDED